MVKAIATAPFDASQLDRLLAEAGLVAVVATSPHNVRYLLGGYRFFLYESADSIGLSRYLPAIAYRPDHLDVTRYVGAGNESWGTDARPPWIADVRNVSWSVEQTASEIASWLMEQLPRGARVGIELPYLPAASYATLAATGVTLVDATEQLEELRAVKRPWELDLIRQSSNAVVDAMLATFAAVSPGDSKYDIAERLRQEETTRGLIFAYVLVAAGEERNRAPSPRLLGADEVLSLDSGATYRGWIADLVRMGIAGEPGSRHEELLAQVDGVQQAARASARVGVDGDGLFAIADDVIAGCPDGERMSFLAHGTGLVSHEAPRLTATGSPPYPAAYARRPLRAGMVLSIETQVIDPDLGLVKLEDTVIIGEDGPEAVGDHGRGWNRIGG